LEQISDPEFNFYYIKPGDTLTRISRRVSGTPDNYGIIVRDNGIADERSVLAGQLLRLRKELCMNNADGVYSRIPRLKSVILPGSVAISEYFDDGAKVLALNRSLGLMYNDRFPITNGARVVYYK
jgi:hypothetical protein